MDKRRSVCRKAFPPHEIGTHIPHRAGTTKDMALDLKAFPRIESVRDTFVFCCFTRLAFIDVKTLKRSDISTEADGKMWIRKNREKTDELSIIPLLDIPWK